MEKVMQNNKIISHSQVKYFLNKVTQNFPNFVAGVITDKNGLPISSKISRNFPYKEQELALEAVIEHRNFIDTTDYIKVKRDLNKDKSIKLLLLLDKPNTYINGFKNLRQIMNRQSLF